MRYGHFDDAAREYVIVRPDTPLPWINYLGSEDYFGLISNTAGGYSFYRDARLRRLTRYRYNSVPFDAGGRYLYLRDTASGELWSPSWQPTRTDVEDYRCRHGLGYTAIGSRHAGIAAETLYFVPPGETLEIWRTRITNRRGERARLSVFSAVEFCLWDAWEDATNFQRNFSTGQVEVVDGVIYHKTEYRERRNHFAYFACSEQLAGFDTQRDAFLGPYRGWERPLAVEQGRSGDSIAHGWAPCGSHHVELELEPGETRELVYLLGYSENPTNSKFDPPGSQTIDKRRVRPVIERYLDAAEVEAAFQRLRDHWSEILDVLHVETPSEHVDRTVNVWNPYQCMVTFALSRSASSFESGVGRGMGFRDSNQDVLGFVHMVPERARERILDLAATQLPSGGAYHQYQPLTKRGNDTIGSGFNDDPLWLVLAVAASATTRSRIVRRPREWTRPSASTAGTATGSAAPTTTSAIQSDPRRTTKAGSSSSRKGCARWRASAWTTARRSARSSRSPSTSRPRTGSCFFSPPSPPTASSSARSARIRRATRRTRASSAIRTPGS